MFRIFFAVLAAILVARCVAAEEPGAYARFKAGCEEVNAEQGAPAGWCDCLLSEVRKSVSEDDLGAAMSPIAPAETFLVVRQKVQDAAATCRAQLRGDMKL